MKQNTDLRGDSSRSRNDYSQYTWLNVLEPRTTDVENNIIEYLHCHRRDLPPAVWIEHYHRAR